MFAQPRTLRCPNCNEMINDSMQQCPYCSVQLDPGVVALVAERQEKANRAYSDASYLKTAAIAMFVFLGISVIPFLGLILRICNNVHCSVSNADSLASKVQ